MKIIYHYKEYSFWKNVEFPCPRMEMININFNVFKKKKIDWWLMISKEDFFEKLIKQWEWERCRFKSILEFKWKKIILPWYFKLIKKYLARLKIVEDTLKNRKHHTYVWYWKRFVDNYWSEYYIKNDDIEKITIEDIEDDYFNDCFDDIFNKYWVLINESIDQQKKILECYEKMYERAWINKLKEWNNK